MADATRSFCETPLALSQGKPQQGQCENGGRHCFIDRMRVSRLPREQQRGQGLPEPPQDHMDKRREGSFSWKTGLPWWGASGV